MRTSTSTHVVSGSTTRHAGAHVPLEDRALRERPHLRERHAVVDAEHELRVIDGVGEHRGAVGAQQVEHLRQVQLALGVVGAQAAAAPPAAPRRRTRRCPY